MKLVLCLAFSAAAFAQTITLDSGFDDSAFCPAGAVWKPGVAGYVPLGSAPWDTLRYSQVDNAGNRIAFTCTIPAPNGFYIVDFGLMEPNATAAGQRRFTITANGSSSTVLDLFRLAGLRQQYTLHMFVAVNDGNLTLVFRPSGGCACNAVVSSISARPWPTPSVVSLSDISVDRGSYAGPLIPFIGADGTVKTAMLMNGTITMEFPNGVPCGIPDCNPPAPIGGIIAFGFPAMQFGVVLTADANGRYVFPNWRPNPSNSVSVYLNGLHLGNGDYHLSWDTPGELPDALIIPAAKSSDIVTVDYVVGSFN